MRKATRITLLWTGVTKKAVYRFYERLNITGELNWIVKQVPNNGGYIKRHTFDNQDDAIEFWNKLVDEDNA